MSSTGAPEPCSTTLSATPAPSTLGAMARMVAWKVSAACSETPTSSSGAWRSSPTSFRASSGSRWADNAIKLAVDMTVAAIARINIQGTTAEQAEQIRTVMATVFPEAVTLVREARQGLQ